MCIHTYIHTYMYITYMLDIREVQALGSNVGGYQDVLLAFFVELNSIVSLGLITECMYVCILNYT